MTTAYSLTWTGNGIAGETSNHFGDNENGAWIIANSWGSGWANGGFIYVPYCLGAGIGNSEEKWLTEKGDSVVGYSSAAGNTGWTPSAYELRGGYEPNRTMKVTMSYDHRSEISVSVGVSQDTTATQPEYQCVFPYINYCGDGKNDGDAVNVKQVNDLAARQGEAIGQNAAHVIRYGAQILANHHASGARGLDGQYSQHRLVVVRHVCAVAGTEPLRNPPQAEQAQHMVDAHRARVLVHRMHHLAVHLVAGGLQVARVERWLAPILALLVIEVRRAADRDAT